MKKCLLNEEQKTLKSNNKIVKFDYEHYIDACKVMAEEIKKNYNLDEDNIELIGMARGGLPMLVTLSHLLGVRKVSMIQTQMSNSDNCHDYGKFRYILHPHHLLYIFQLSINISFILIITFITIA